MKELRKDFEDYEIQNGLIFRQISNNKKLIYQPGTTDVI